MDTDSSSTRFLFLSKVDAVKDKQERGDFLHGSASSSESQTHLWRRGDEECRSGRLGYALGKPLGLTGLRCGLHARDGREARLGRLGGNRPMANRKLEKGFLIFKSFLNSKPI
jgi:hypothetical protein